jgi:hypothetical protein
MSQTRYILELEKELQKLNEKIDLKIVYGQSYSSDARRHKVLLEQARKLKKKRMNSFMSKILSPFYRA